MILSVLCVKLKITKLTQRSTEKTQRLKDKSLIHPMLRIGDTIFSLDILEKKFRCDLPRCLGNCCRYGDSGAPLTERGGQYSEKNLA